VTASKLRVLIFGAHPDDPDGRSGGTAALYARGGHTVKMVSLTNGDAGHMWEGGAPLAWRRRIEAANSGKVLGAEYITLDSHDGMLMPLLEVRNEVIAIVRNFKPDLVICPRMWDYHPDHRACGVVVVDAMYMATVPNVVSGAEHLRKMPVIAYCYDQFQKPYPVQPDVVVDISPVLDQKIDALACHVSQMYEWLPYNRSAMGEVPEGAAERRAWLKAWYGGRAAQQAAKFRAELVARYGEQRGQACVAAETYEGSEYGSPLTAENKDILFPF
jgi:LmbE family N-acetylglucosaminyl deacetylase